MEESKVSKAEEKNEKKKSKLLIIIILIALILIAIVAAGTAYFLLRNKFKDASLELGQNEIGIDNFLVSKYYKEKAEVITDLTQIDFSKVGEAKIVLAYNGKEETVKLNIVDTTPPEVTFQNITKYTGYKIDANDFIVEKKDLSEMVVETTAMPDTTEYKDHIVKIVVKDIYGNETSKDCVLTISWIKAEVNVELGETFTKENIIVNMEADSNKIDQTEIAKVNTMALGEYKLLANFNGVDYISTVTVQDTTPPDLQLKEVSIYDDEKVKGKEAFIKSATDASGEVKTTLKTQIDYTKLGTQEIVIEAEDINGNKIEKTTTFTRKKDTDGPVISGLSNITTRKNAQIDYRSNVKAVDTKDGNCEFSVDTSKVNLAVAGTYYATYTSQDTKGNKTTAKRKIVVNHDEADVRQLVARIAGQCGNGVEEIRDFVRNKISYSHSYGDGDPIWYGFNNWSRKLLCTCTMFSSIIATKRLPN